MAYLGLEPTPHCLMPLIEEIEERTKRLTGGLDDRALGWRPPDGGWSVAQVFEHLVMGNELYFPVMRGLLADVTPASPGEAPPWRPSFFGRLLIRSLRPVSRRKLPTTSKLKPGLTVRDGVINEFLRTMRDTSDIIWKAHGLDLRRLRMTSPVSSLVRGLNLGDAFIIIVVHAQRHLGQIERVQAATGFPRAAA